MSPDWHAHFNATCRFPRVSGDEPTSVTYIADNTEFSPRERG